ncbi:PREDICTED: copper transporter 1-like [Ipomoea nil]|uniref:copper transporter 1-like n=1 Tax=Ipomoea nil TaxID=35883 RepID=UPI00090092B5|nr:PREDICTED: copper transporter 1-like [Ipomoea nil]
MSHEHSTMYNNGTMMDMGDMSAAMHMSLFWGKDVTILFDGWPENRLGMYILSLVFIFCLAFIVEVLSASPLTAAPMPPLRSPVVGAAIYAVRVALGYLVMLAVMSFNIGVFVVAVVGHALGYFLVKFRARAAAPPPETTSDNTTKV